MLYEIQRLFSVEEIKERLREIERTGNKVVVVYFKIKYQHVIKKYRHCLLSDKGSVQLTFA
jgi:hypothetical protein